MIPQENKLLSLLSNNDVTFFIPPYQRNYEWTEGQCKVFLDDIYKTSDQNASGRSAEHFFGSITYFQTEAVFGQPNRLVLIDGQQRITTTMLFLVALRDINQDQNVKKFIDSKYLKNNNISSDSEYKIKLKQVETDWVAYKKIILSEDMSDKEKDSAVYRNYRYFYNKLSDYEEKGGNISSLIEKGLNKFSVITIQLEPDKNSWENPQEIFESMNSLGKPLSLADLVRNYLLLGLNPETQSELYSRYWLHIEQVIPGKVSDFIRDYMQASQKKAFPKSTEANYKELYSSFKRVFADSDAKGLLKELSDNSTVYSYITGGESSGNVQIDKELRDLNTMGLTTAYSFLMILLRTWKQGKFTSQDIISILSAFKIYCMRRRIILGLTSSENKNFPILANCIDTLLKAADKKTEMFKILSNQENNLRLPNDIELSRYLETMNFANFRYCKFYLSLIEEKITKSRPDQNDTKLQIEHIMPQTLNDEWKKSLGENADAIHQELVHTIGNLTLIRHNQELGNKKFKEKKDVYENNAGLQIARKCITNHDKWGEDEIRTRAKWMIGFLLQEVLPIPDSMRKTNNFRVKNGKHLSFQELQLIGEDIYFIANPSIIAHVVGDKDVEFEGKKWKLSGLTKELQTRRGLLTPSGSYQGAQYWAYDGMKLADIM